jgi:hypothetical protein
MMGMTDGPFKNAVLTGRWKRFGESLLNDAMSPDERCERAEHALSKDLTPQFRALVSDVDQFINLPQQALLPRSAVEAIFDKHARSPLTDTLQRFFSANLARPMAIEIAWNLALDSTIKREAGDIRMRIVEECMHARDRKELPGAQYSRAIERLNESIESIKLSKMRADLTTNKSAPRAALAKQVGLDDGPNL